MPFFFRCMQAIPKYRLPAEWESQSAIQFTWPHQGMDWGADLEIVRDRIEACISLITEDQCVILVVPSIEEVAPRFSHLPPDRLIWVELPSNDAWARDHGPLFVQAGQELVLLDYQFNGWGEKYPADLDNQITEGLYQAGIFTKVAKRDMDLVLEGGSIESDGEGTLLTTWDCLMHPLRNPQYTWEALQQRLKSDLGVERVLALKNGKLRGDDTDGHIDTLARFCSPGIIAFVDCQEEEDEHYAVLQKMKAELSTWRTAAGTPYALVPLPLPDPCYHPADGHRLPATYANFIISNQYVIVPTYQQEKDQQAIEQLKQVFLDRKVVGVDALPIIRQHGSLHCLCMHYPIGALSNTI